MWLWLVVGFAVADSPNDSEENEDWAVNNAHGATHTAQIEVNEGTWISVSAHDESLVFDLLGDLWLLPLEGGEATRLTSGAAWDSEPRFSPDGEQILYVSDEGGNEQIWVVNREGTEKRQVTEEKVARVTDPIWDPDGDWIIARRRTVDTRSIGVTELWQYHLEGGDGFALTKLAQHPHAGESTTDGRHIWFSSRNGRFQYNHNAVGGLWKIMRLDRTTAELLPVVAGPGSGARPHLSPNGELLSFISRDRTQTLLEVLDVGTGRRRVVADWLDHDQMEGFALHGVYPSMSWLNDDELVLWARGKLWRVALDGTRQEIPFSVSGDWDFHDVDRWPNEIGDDVRAKIIRWPTWAPDGSVAFSAMGILWVRNPKGDLHRVSPGTGYAPAWSPDGKELAWTSFGDADGGRLHITRGTKTETLPLVGQLVNPAWSADGQHLAVLRGIGGMTDADLASELWFELVLLKRGKKGWTRQVVTSMANRGVDRAARLFFYDDRIWFLEARAAGPREPDNSVLVSVKFDGTDKKTHLILPGGQEIVPSPDFKKVAYRHGHQAWVTALPHWGREVDGKDEALP
ncbi:MAG: hypothetical protein HN348_27985, partial [Proteobacteria bacterium]|nr:hypothetical protein [Pseudomonadota bacterium]